jgi:hypothetical protein
VEGQYLVVWNDGTDTRTEDLTVNGAVIGGLPPAPGDATPTVADLAQLIPSRATGRFTGGTSAPAFPDEERVQAVITMASALVTPRLGGSSLPEKFYPLSRALITLRAAILLEPAAWPEQARPDKSAYEQWREQYQDDLEALIEIIRLDAQDGDTGDGGPEAGSRLPVYAFPCEAVFDAPVTWWP